MTDTAGAEGAQAAPQATQAPEVDFGPVFDRMDQLGARFDQFEQSFQPEYGYEPQEPGYQYGQPDQFQGQPQVDQYGQPAQQGYQQPTPEMGQQEAVQQLQGLIGQAVQQAIAPINQRFAADDEAKAQKQYEADAEYLTTTYPELKENWDQFETQAVEQAKGMAEQIVQRMGAGNLPPQQQQAAIEQLADLIADQRGYLELSYLGSKARESATQETPASTSQEFQLEAGGGAAQPGGEQVSEGSQYLGTAGQNRERTLNELWNQ